VTETLIVMLSVPFALVGGLWLMWWLGFNLSVAVAVGFVALASVAAETGVVMLIYLDAALKEMQARHGGKNTGGANTDNLRHRESRARHCDRSEAVPAAAFERFLVQHRFEAVGGSGVHARRARAWS
jgi:Cu/Ag efflux pump CusA